jgi:hypothetical protein
LLGATLDYNRVCWRNPRRHRAILLAALIFTAAVCPADLRAQSAAEGWQFRSDGDPQILTITQVGASEALRRYPVIDALGRPARITCLIDAPPRRSVIAVLATAGEIWEMAVDADAPPVYPGFVHNFRVGQVEGIAPEPQPFARRRLRLEIDHSWLIFSTDFLDVIAKDGQGGFVAYNLDARRPSARYSALPFNANDAQICDQQTTVDK